jgi:peptidyl-prolyl cis-trans isomerase B (cyclophilin B)
MTSFIRGLPSRSFLASALKIAALAFLAAGAAHARAENPRVEFKTTMGSFTLELYPDKAPKTVENFLQYVNGGFYKGTIFHRVIDNFMIQGGGFTPDMKQKETRGPIENEAGIAMKGGLKNEVGPLAARHRICGLRPGRRGNEYGPQDIQGGHDDEGDEPERAAAADHHRIGRRQVGQISMVKLHTNHGVIALELDAKRAPETAKNFLAYAEAGFYSNTVFHRVIDGFMIQGGGFEPGMRQKPTRAPIKNEADNGLKNDRYTVAMARTSDPHSASSQVFINVKDNDFLNHTAPDANGWGYCVFGKVVEGQDIVDKIKGVKTGKRGFHSDVPVEDVLIERAEVV